MLQRGLDDEPCQVAGADNSYLLRKVLMMGSVS
jgi:hypothetical protein